MNLSMRERAAVTLGMCQALRLDDLPTGGEESTRTGWVNLVANLSDLDEAAEALCLADALSDLTFSGGYFSLREVERWIRGRKDSYRLARIVAELAGAYEKADGLWSTGPGPEVEIPAGFYADTMARRAEEAREYHANVTY